MTDNNSFLLDSRVSELNPNFKQYNAKAFISIRMELPFQLPFEDYRGIYSNKYRKGVINKIEHKMKNGKQIYYSVVEVINVLLKFPDNWNDKAFLNEIFDESLSFLNHVINNIRIMEDVPKLREITMIDLPVAVPIFFFEGAEIKERKQKTLLFMLHLDTFEYIDIHKFSRHKMDKLAGLVDVADSDKFRQALYFQRRAVIDYNNKIYFEAVIKLQTYVEMFMFQLGELIMIHKKYDKQKISNIQKGQFKNLVTDHLKPFFERNGLSFGLETEGFELYDYWHDCYLLRNKIVHEGYIPSESEASRAFDVATTLISKCLKTIKKSDYNSDIYNLDYLITNL